MAIDWVKMGKKAQRFYEALIGRHGGRGFDGEHSLDDTLHDYMAAVAIHCEYFHPEFGKFRLGIRKEDLVLKVLEEGPETSKLHEALEVAKAA